MSTVIFDIDNTVGNYSTVVRRAGNVMGTLQPGASKRPGSYSFVDAGWFATAQDYFDSHCFAIRAGWFADMPATYWDIDRVVRDLHMMGHDVVVCTARRLPFQSESESKAIIRDTKHWVGENMPSVDDLIVCAPGEKNVVCGNGIFVDDAPENIEQCARAGQGVIVAHQLYNRSFNDLPRVANASGVPGAVETLVGDREEVVA